MFLDFLFGFLSKRIEVPSRDRSIVVMDANARLAELNEPPISEIQEQCVNEALIDYVFGRGIRQLIPPKHDPAPVVGPTVPPMPPSPSTPPAPPAA